jgi:hypothetical protein
MREAPRLAVAAVLAAAALAAPPAAAKQKAPTGLSVLSSRADLVSGGDALVALDLPARAGRTAKVKVIARGHDFGKGFTRVGPRRLIGIVSGLRNGRNLITARLPDGWGAELTVTNHPNGGPVFSGPQVQPWRCQRTAKDRQCNEPPRYRFLYKPIAGRGLAPFDPRKPPADFDTTTTDQGVRVPFVVREETGYQDRDQYKILTLFQPGQDWTAAAPQPQWNRKVLITHGFGCGVSYGAGSAPLGDLPSLGDPAGAALARGFAVMSTALDHNQHNCNIVTQAESLLMAKERLTERYGEIRYTIGVGCSGGSVTTQQVANAYPGVYQGLVVSCTYPDTLSPGLQFAEYHLLRRYFENPGTWAPGVFWLPTQMAEVEGHLTPINAITADEGLFKSVTDPTYPCDGLTDAQRYHPAQNPGGARCTFWDYMINVFGPRPQSEWGPAERTVGRGFANLPLGGVGVQYGLKSFLQGELSTDQFLDVNAKIGGLDIDRRPIPQRVAGSDSAIAAAYRSGAINSTNNLDTTAIINHAGPEPGVAHDYRHSMWVRWRLEREHGSAANQVMWFGLVPGVGDLDWAQDGFVAMDRWLRAVERDKSSKSLAHKVAVDRPVDIRDRCTQLDLNPLCNLDIVQTIFSTPRAEAGGPREDDLLKCRLRALDRADYRSRLSDAQWERLKATFPTGVCDFSQTGVGEQDTVPWQTYQDSKGRVIYGGRAMPASPKARQFGCLAPRAAVGKRAIGRVRLGRTRRGLRGLPGPVTRGSRAWRWCTDARHRRQLRVVFGSKARSGKVGLVASTSPGHRYRGLRAGSRTSALRARLPRARRVAKGIYRAGPRSTRLIGVRAGKVRWIGVAGNSTIARPKRLRAYLRAAGL